MSEPIVVALIGLGGVVVGTLLGWILKSRWELRREKKGYAREDVLQLRKSLLNFLEVLETHEWGMYHGAWWEVVMAWGRIEKNVRELGLHKELRTIMMALPQRELMRNEFHELESSIREAVRIIDQSVS